MFSFKVLRQTSRNCWLTWAKPCLTPTRSHRATRPIRRGGQRLEALPEVFLMVDAQGPTTSLTRGTLWPQRAGCADLGEKTARFAEGNRRHLAGRPNDLTDGQIAVKIPLAELPGRK